MQDIYCEYINIIIKIIIIIKQETEPNEQKEEDGEGGSEKNSQA